MLLKKRGFTLVEIMIVVAIIALLAGIAIPALLRSRVTANETNAQATLRTISTAAETYFAANQEYPASMAAMTDATPAYLNEDYEANPPAGYEISCTFTTSSYTCAATPSVCGTTGTKNYSIETGSVWGDEVDC